MAGVILFVQYHLINEEDASGLIHEKFPSWLKKYTFSFLPSTSFRNDPGSYQENVQLTISIFSKCGRPSGKPWVYWVLDKELESAHVHVIINCDEVKLYLELFVQCHLINEEDASGLIHEKFPSWLKKYTFSFLPSTSFRNDPGSYQENVQLTISIFSKCGRPSGKPWVYWVLDKELESAHVHVIINCDEVKLYLELFVQYHLINEEDASGLIHEKFPSWLKKYTFSFLPSTSFRNDPGSYQENVQLKISIFSKCGRPSGKPCYYCVLDKELESAHVHVILNCDEVKLYLELFVQYHLINEEDASGLIHEKFPSWLKKYTFSFLPSTSFRNDPGSYQKNVQLKISIFSKCGRPSGKPWVYWVLDKELESAHVHVILNCDEVKLYLELFVQYHLINEEDASGLIHEKFPSWLKKYE
ncbi:hypothetical protein KIW84_075250 [Lathyrus oleraceus]|uniref:Uncharacterized protein n=1 Tax=Pisum sativum TaxID=3888 RepID=A0A9D5A1P0_PEA|nr:hypothetical protein KIW84_075250 [Pisum sativum]